jgi:phage tail protein X
MNRYSTIRNASVRDNTIKRSSNNIYYKIAAKYPLIPQRNNDIYAISEWGDRYERLAFRFYGDVSLWWIIAIANPNIADFSSLFLPVGSEIRIPREISNIIDSYNALNR